MVATLLAGAIYAVRYRASLDAARSNAASWKEERDAERFKADRLENERHGLEVELAELRGKTDLTALSKQIDDTARVFMEEMRASSTQLSEEHRALMALMEQEAKISAERHLANQKIVTSLLERRRTGED